MCSFGRKILEKAFADEGRELTDKAIEEVAKKLRLAKAEDVYADVGRGALRGAEVLQAVFPELKRAGKVAKQGRVPAQLKPISIRGLTEGISYKLGQCCHPLPGDRIVGMMTPGEGRGRPHHRLRRTGQGAEHGRLAGCGLGPGCRRHGPVGGAHPGAGEERAGRRWPR